MPSHSQQTTTSQSTTGPVTSGGSTTSSNAQDTLGNQALLQAMESKPAGQLNWESALGEALGSKLYGALSDKLSDAELQKAAESAVASATKKMGEFIRSNADATEQDAANALVSALDAEIKRVAGDTATGPLADVLREFVDENPVLITSAAFGAATAWVLSNQSIGLVSSQLKLGGGHSLIGGVDPGKTLDLAIQQVRVGYRYKGGGSSAQVVGDYFADDSWKLTGAFSQTTDLGGKASLSGLHHQRGDHESRTRLDLGYTQNGVSGKAFWERERDLGSDVSTLGGQLSMTRDDWSAYMRAQASNNGTHEAAAGFNQSLDKNTSWGVEAFSSENDRGVSDRGVRAVFKWKF